MGKKKFNKGQQPHQQQEPQQGQQSQQHGQVPQPHQSQQAEQQRQPPQGRQEQKSQQTPQHQHVPQPRQVEQQRQVVQPPQGQQTKGQSQVSQGRQEQQSQQTHQHWQVPRPQQAEQRRQPPQGRQEQKSQTPQHEHVPQSRQVEQQRQVVQPPQGQQTKSQRQVLQSQQGQQAKQQRQVQQGRQEQQSQQSYQGQQAKQQRQVPQGQWEQRSQQTPQHQQVLQPRQVEQQRQVVQPPQGPQTKGQSQVSQGRQEQQSQQTHQHWQVPRPQQAEQQRQVPQPQQGQQVKQHWQVPRPQQAEQQRQVPQPQQVQPQHDGTKQGDQRGSEKQQQPKAQQMTSQQMSGEPTKQSSAVELAIPQRKKLNSAGTLGRPILIETNHLALSFKNLKSAIHYDVDIDPNLPKKLLRPAVEAFRRKHYSNRYPAFDGRKNLYSATHLPINDPFSDTVVVNDDGRDKSFKITIKFAAMVDLSVINKFFETVNANRHLVTPQEAIQCLDIVLRSAPSLNCIPVGRSFFTQPAGRIIDLGEGMEMYYGFYQSAVLGWKPYLNVDVSHKAFPKSSNVLDLIKDLCPNCNLDSPLRPFDKETLNKFLRTLKVQYEIPGRPATKRVMRVNELNKSASEAQFKTEDGRNLTVQEYFQTEKAYRLRYPHLPCLWVGSKQREQKILLPPELCTVVPGQVTNRTMTGMQTSNMIKIAATSTTERKAKIMHSIRQANYNQDPCVREFDLQVGQEFTSLQARVLKPPTLRYADKQENPFKGVWRAQKFLNVVHLKDQWAIVSVDDRTKFPALNEFSQMLTSQGRQVGMEIQMPIKQQCICLKMHKERQQLEELFSSCNGLRLVLVIIPTDKKDVYNYVKQVAELRVGTLTQCVKGRNVFRPKPSTVGNILLKINAKLNGTNHALHTSPKCLQRPCMIMGADVTHPSPESRGSVPSVAAVTASHDPRAFQYNITWRLQASTKEIISDLQNIVKEHLLYFYKKNNGAKPEKIIFFRDGVSEGQFVEVSSVEIQAIRRACSGLGDGTFQPKITFLVVQKRHHARFFPTNPRDSEDRNMNVPAGTVVDTEITHPTALDFYLVSHASIQGVAKPTKYRILWDDNDMNEDEIEELTYHLCHLFSRCTRSVSYPAPTYYAHLAAARAKVYTENRHINMDSLDREFSALSIKEQVLKGLPMFFV